VLGIPVFPTVLIIVVGVIVMRILGRVLGPAGTSARERELQERVERLESIITRMSEQMGQLTETQEFTARLLAKRQSEHQYKDERR